MSSQQNLLRAVHIVAALSVRAQLFLKPGVAGGQRARLLDRGKGRVKPEPLRGHEVGREDGGAARAPARAVHEHAAAALEPGFYENVAGRDAAQQVGVVLVADADGQVVEG